MGAGERAVTLGGARGEAPRIECAPRVLALHHDRDFEALSAPNTSISRATAL